MAITAEQYKKPPKKTTGSGVLAPTTNIFGGTTTYTPTSTSVGSAGNNSPAAAAKPAPVQPEPVSDGGGSWGGGGGGSPAAPAPVAEPPAPTPIKDIDWFNQDGVYKAAAGNALASLTEQLAQILADRDAGYQQLGNSREELGRNREDDLTGLGDDFAGRGLLGSGLYAQADDEVAADYARQGSALDQSAAKLAQNYGQQNAKVDLGKLPGLAGGGLNNGASLDSILGLLGSKGVGAGNQYQSALQKAQSASAEKATAPLINTIKW